MNHKLLRLPLPLPLLLLPQPPQPNPTDQTPKEKGTKEREKGKMGEEGKREGPRPCVPESEGARCLSFLPEGDVRDPCPFKHKMIKGLSAPQAKAKAAAAPKAGSTTKAAVAVVMALASGVAGHPANHGAQVTLDVIGDTGAGEHLGSRSAFAEQGVNHDLLERFVGTSQKPMSFDTGGGQKSTIETVGLWSESLQSLSNVYMLKSCPR